MKGIHVLFRIHPSEDLFLTKMWRQGTLNEDAVDLLGLVQSANCLVDLGR
jgi:hypothetical protein